MTTDDTRARVRRLAAQRLEQKAKGIAVAPILLAVRKELVPDRPQTSRYHAKDVGKGGSA